MASIAVVISVNQAQDLIQLRATDEEGNMISSDVQKIDRPYCGTKTVTIDIPDEMIKHAIKKREYFAIGRKNGKEYVQISREVNGNRIRTDPIEIPWKPEYRTMVLEVTDDKFKKYDETESVRHITDCEDIILDKTKSKPWVRPSDRYDPVRYAWKIAHGDMFPNVYELAEEEKFKHLIQLIDWDKRDPWINTVTPCNNFDYRQKEKTMNKKTIKDIDRIVITRNDLNEVLLRAYSGDEIVEKTIAKCNPNDIFDFNIGAKLAVDRLYDGYDMTPKPKRKLYNGKIFIRAISRELGYYWFPAPKKYEYEYQTNKLHNVVNGKIPGLETRVEDLIYDDMRDDELGDILKKTNTTSRSGGLFLEFIDGYFVR